MSKKRDKKQDDEVLEEQHLENDEDDFDEDEDGDGELALEELDDADIEPFDDDLDMLDDDEDFDEDEVDDEVDEEDEDEEDEGEEDEVDEEDEDEEDEGEEDEGDEEDEDEDEDDEEAEERRKAKRRKKKKEEEVFKPTAKPVSTRPKVNPADAPKVWKRLSSGVDESSVRPYSLREPFAEEEPMIHPRFGLGFVLEVLTPTKIEVVFQDGLRRLVCNRG